MCLKIYRYAEINTYDIDYIREINKKKCLKKNEVKFEVGTCFMNTYIFGR